MDCKHAQALLPSYFDGELDRATIRDFEAHLDTCEDCRAALIELDTLRGALRRDATRFAAPDSLRERIENDARQNAVKASSPTPRARMRWLALAASWVFAFGAGGVVVSAWHAQSSVDAAAEQTARDLFASHWRALAAASPVDVVSTDRHTVKPWFEGKVAQAPPVHDFAEQGFSLIGGRIDYVGSARVPVLVYRHAQHLIDVFVLPPTLEFSNISELTLQGYRIDPIHLGDQAAVIVSDMDRQELDRFAQLAAAAR